MDESTKPESTPRKSKSAKSVPSAKKRTPTKKKRSPDPCESQKTYGLTPADALDFCHKYYKKEGRKFSTEGREWVETELFTPALSWKVWPRVDASELRDEERAKIGAYVQWTPERVLSMKDTNLGLFPTMVVALNLPRGAGKTTNASAFKMAVLAKTQIKTAFVASAGQQARTLLLENFISPIADDRLLSKAFTTKHNKLIYSRTKGRSSSMEIMDSSPRSISGRRLGIIYIDEARDVNGEVFARLLFSIKAASFFFCPYGHSKTNFKDGIAPECPTCKAYMYPFIPKVILTSTSGMSDGSVYDWFNELIENLLENPSRYAHVYRDDEALNPSISVHENQMIDEVFMPLHSISDALDVERNNIPRTKGETFATLQDVRAVFDKSIQFQRGSQLPCVAFLDTSEVGDLTSLVITEQDPERGEEWEFVRVAHIKTWDPKNRGQCPLGYVNEELVLEYLCKVLPLFPKLLRLQIDTRGVVKWPKEMLNHIRDQQVLPLAHLRAKVDGMGDRRVTRKADKPRQVAWSQFQMRMMGRTWRCPSHDRAERELRGMRKHMKGEFEWEIKDANKNLHADVMESIVQCCRIIWEIQTGKIASTDVALREFQKASGTAFIGGSIVGPLTEDMF